MRRIELIREHAHESNSFLGQAKSSAGAESSMDGARTVMCFNVQIASAVEFMENLITQLKVI